MHEGDPERLEHRLEDVLGVVAGDQADVQRDAGALGEAAEEVRDEVGAETADARLREIDVGGEHGRSETSRTTCASASSTGRTPEP